VAVTYQNQTLGVPGVYTFVNPNGLTVQPSGANNLVVLVGSSTGGPPGQFVIPPDPLTARDQFVGGDLVNAYQFAVNAGAGQVALWRVDPATQSSLTIYGSNGQPSFTVTSADYGAYTDTFALAISGTVGNLTATFYDGYRNLTYSQSGLGPAGSIAYTGNATAAVGAITNGLTAPTVTVSSGTGGNLGSGTWGVAVVAKNAASRAVSTVATANLTASNNTLTASWGSVVGAFTYDVYLSGTTGFSFITSVPATPTATTYTATITQPGQPTTLPTATSGPAFVALLAGQTDGSQNINLALTGNYATFGQLVSYLNVQAGYTAQTASSLAAQIPCTLLDPSTANTSLLGSGMNVTSNTGAVVTWLNNLTIGSLPYVNAVAATPLNPPANLPLTNLVGGTTGTAGLAQWQAAAQALIQFTQQNPGGPLPRYVVALTSQIPFAQALAQAVTTSVNQFPPLFTELFIGGGTAPTVQTEIQRSAQFASHRVINAGWSFYGYDTSMNYTLFPGYMLAAIYAGLRANLGVATPLTNKLLPGVLAIANPPSPAQVAQLLENGVAVPMVNEVGQIVISRGVTTSPIHANLYDREESVTNVADAVRIFLIQNTANTNTNIIGAPNYGNVTTKALIGWINSLLDKVQTLGWIAGYTPVTQLTPIQGNPLYLAAQITIQVPTPINVVAYTLNLTVPQAA